MARRTHLKSYRSGLEKEVAAWLKDKQKKVRYEELKVEWEDLKYRTYTPDFVLDNGIIIETKGYLIQQIDVNTVKYSVNTLS